MSNKILIIGQALPAVAQALPYDTTMLYDWIEEASGITKEQAQDIFEFDAVYGAFTGHNKQGGHKPPTKKQMNDYWNLVLRDKFIKHDYIWILGSVAFDFLHEKAFGKGEPKGKVICTIHPSKRNIYAFRKDRESLINTVKNMIDDFRKSRT